MDPEFLIKGMVNELQKALKAMDKAKSLEEKREYSLIIKNLSQSLSVFFSMAADFMGFEEEI